MVERNERASPIVLQSLWWLNPTYLFTLVTLLTVHWAISMSPEAYRLYDTPKYIDASYYQYAFMAVLAFALGHLFSASVHTTVNDAPEAHSTILLRCFWICTVLCFLAYCVWLLVGIKNGFRPGMILDFINARDDKLGTFELKEKIFPTVPGITTLTQCGVVAMMLGLMTSLWNAPRVKVVVLAIVGVAFLRAMLLSERLALIELVIVSFLVLFRLHIMGRAYSPRLLLGLKLAPVFGPILLLVLFGSFEYFRSYQFYKNRFNNIAEFTIWRVSAYYTTGLNNGALIHEEWDHWPLPYQSITAVWSFPLVKYSPFSYQKLTGIDPDTQFDHLLRLRAVEEYNNDSGLFAPLNDFGVLGLALFWMGFGFLAGLAHRSYLRGNVFGLCYFPLFFLTILETPRFIYLTLSRATPPIIVLVLLWYFIEKMRITRSTQERIISACASPT
jgi:oligosaccharide repeat unit polymerase